MSKKLITIEEQQGPFKTVLQRIMRMVPERDPQNPGNHKVRLHRQSV